MRGPHDFVLIANPVSGNGRAALLAQRVSELLARTHAVCVRLTEGPQHARILTQEAVRSGAGVVVACGGDGTQQEVASALVGTQAILGVLPGGRCNDFAAMLGLSRDDPVERLAQNLIAGPTPAVDLGTYRSLDPLRETSDPRYFCTVATCGFDSAVTEFVRTHRFPWRGMPEYLFAIFCVLRRFEPIELCLKGDFGIWSGRVFLVATGNTTCYGGGMRIVPEARMDDGLLNLCVIEAVPKSAVLRILPKVFKGKHITHPAVKMFQTRTLDLLTPKMSTQLCADGESLGFAPARLGLAIGALRIRGNLQQGLKTGACPV